MIARAALACALAACGDDGAMPGPDAAVGSCTLPELQAPWLRSYVEDIVTTLATSPRATLTQRSSARTFLLDRVRELGSLPQLNTYATGANVHWRIPATTGAAPTIIVGAHFDSVAGSPGANDNATGVAAVLAVARYLSELSCRSYNVTFVLFDEEESGLVGARVFASQVVASGVVAVHTVDQIGWDADLDRRFELELPTQELEAEYRAAAAVVGVDVVRTSTEGTDHEAFRDRGFAAVGLTEEYAGGDTTPHRHLAGDTTSTVDFDYLALGTQLVARVVMTELQ